MNKVQIKRQQKEKRQSHKTCISKKPRRNAKMVTVITSAMMIFSLLSGISIAGGSFFWGDAAFAAVTPAATPDVKDYGGLKWQLQEGTGYANAPTPPAVVGDNLYVGSGDRILKIDKNTGSVVARSSALADTVGYATIAPTYAEVGDKKLLFVPLSEGQIQALDANTLKSLWITKKYLGDSNISEITYDNGYIYTGTWRTETSNGKYMCFDVTDADTAKVDERKAPKWTVTKKGGFYWAGADVSSDYVLFASEDGTSGSSAASATLYSCRKGAECSPEQDPVVDSKTVKGDCRSGITYDDTTKAYYFTSKAGLLYKVKLGNDGKFEGDLQQLSLGSSTTGTPAVYKGKIYVGTADKKVQVIDGETMTIKDSQATPGFVQSGILLSTAKETSPGQLTLYMTYNALPGGIYMVKVTENGEKLSAGEHLFRPAGQLSQYCISQIVSDDAGTLYYKNDSCRLMAINEGFAIMKDASSGGSIAGAQSIKSGENASFEIKANSGYKIADVKADSTEPGKAVSIGAVSTYTFENVTSPHYISAVFIPKMGVTAKSVKSASYKNIKLTWSKMANVTGYEVCRDTSKNGRYSKRKLVTATSLTDTGLTTGKRYYYKIRGYYRASSGALTYSELSDYKYAVPTLNKTSLKTTAGKKSIKLTWPKVSGASGYAIYRSAKKTGSYKAVKIIASASVRSWTNKSLKKGKIYYYKLKAYRKVGGSKVYGEYSNISYKKAK